jgi:hypothetical protein
VLEVLGERIEMAPIAFRDETSKGLAQLVSRKAPPFPVVSRNIDMFRELVCV